MSTVAITIRKKIPLLGKGDSLETRLRRVTLRGFPEVDIYAKASFVQRDLTAQEIPQALYTPQPHVHKEYLARINTLAKLFADQNVDIFHLDYAYDYVAVDSAGEATEWTMAPPIVERFKVPHTKGGHMDYTQLLASELRATMRENNWKVNPLIKDIRHAKPDTIFSLINDGSHRVHAGLQRGDGIRVLEISNTTPGYPYYAAPQDYSTVQVFDDTKNSPDLKINTLAPPAHKLLYRQFPEAGILTGTIRPPRAGEKTWL